MTNLLERLFIILLIVTAGIAKMNAKTKEGKQAARIVNVINFIRQTEPRINEITDEVLFQTTAEEVKLLNRNNIKGTYLLQYDALINPKYHELLTKEALPGTEIGAWWEITQPHVEAAGIKWRGRYPWDWHSDVGFSVGYTTEEREKLVDVYMAKFKEIFGEYPKSVGSWFIDAHTLAYMYDKYHIVASCTCKDQIGTDGYTLWGGYWQGGYYPSRKNAYMPAQSEKGQIKVPVFRMLGSDPIYQYDCGIGGAVQHVVSLEPVYGDAGGSENWVNWFFKSSFDDPCLNYSYTQAGQENSFTWGAMRKGLEIQIPILSKLQDKKEIRVETLAETGKWFNDNFATTPASAISAMTDYTGNNKKTIWYNSKNYRVNLLWEGNKFRFRDIHMFNEGYASDYLNKPCTSSKCVYTTLPIVDGNMWSTNEVPAGLRLFYQDASGKMVEATGAAPIMTNKGKNLLVEWPLKNGKFTMYFDETKLKMTCVNRSGNPMKWYLELTTVSGAQLPYTDIKDNAIEATQKDFKYEMLCKGGKFVDQRNNQGKAFRIEPKGKELILLFKN